MGLIDRTEPNKTAEVETREPDYSAGGEYPYDNLPVAHGTKHDELTDLASLPRVGRRVPFAAETRKLVVVDYGSLSGTVTLDGAGAGTIDLGTIPSSEYWIIDAVIGRGGAAGSVLLYERGNVSSLNDLDLVFAKLLLGPAFAVSDYPTELVLRPGAHLFAAFVGAGNALQGTAKIMYRIAVLIGGSQEGGM